MTLRLLDRVAETTASAGTGPFTLGGAIATYQSFAAAGFAGGDTTYAAIIDPTAAAWVVALVTYNSPANSLTVNTILASSNKGAAVNFSGNPAKQVFCDAPAALIAYLLNPPTVPSTAFVTAMAGVNAVFVNGGLH